MSDTSLFANKGPRAADPAPVLRHRRGLHGLTTWPVGAHFDEVSDLFTGKLYFVVDISGSMKGRRLAAAVRGAQDLLSAVVGFGYLGGVISFAGTASVTVPLTADVHAIARRLDRLHPVWTGTDLSKGIALGHRELAGRRGDRVLALFTDGETDRRSAERAAAAARADGIRIVCEFAGTADPAFMKALAGTDDTDDRPVAADHEVANRIAGLARSIR